MGVAVRGFVSGQLFDESLQLVIPHFRSTRRVVLVSIETSEGTSVTTIGRRGCGSASCAFQHYDGKPGMTAPHSAFGIVSSQIPDGVDLAPSVPTVG